MAVYDFGSCRNKPEVEHKTRIFNEILSKVGYEIDSSSVQKISIEQTMKVSSFFKTIPPKPMRTLKNELVKKSSIHKKKHKTIIKNKTIVRYSWKFNRILTGILKNNSAQTGQKNKLNANGKLKNAVNESKSTKKEDEN